MKPCLLIMAAWLGSRYGGLKQIDPVGPNGEILLEFALKDAIAIDIENVVVIVSETIRTDFETMIIPKYIGKLQITLVTQALNTLPDGFQANPERTKPWWTAHAVWCARGVITWPFIVMNADDFYGRDALKQAYDFLMSHNESSEHCIITYPITSTLSDFGTVSRGICTVNNGKLTKIVEHTKVGYKGDQLIHLCEDGREITIDQSSPANMNLFGFQASFLQILEKELLKFLTAFGSELTREFFLPSVVMEMIKENTGAVTALSTTSSWFGMTNREDRIEAKNKIQALVGKGMY